MTIAQKYNVIDTEKGTLDRSVMTDERTYQDELEKIFGRAWLMLAHESLIPNPNDFFLAYMGEDPVIITRDAKDQVHVFLNMCRHRGNRVVRADDGNAKNFMCTYHGWTFSNEGKLVSVPGLQEAYYGELDVERLGLVEARCDTYAGIIFATWAEDAPSLEAYLGDMRWYTDFLWNHRDEGMQVIGPVKWPLPVNWKTPVDNDTDFYHTAISHYSASLVRSRYQGFIGQGGQGPNSPPQGFAGLFRNTGKQVAVNGHILTARVRETDLDGVGFGQSRGAVTVRSLPFWEQHVQNILPEMERRLGPFRARRLGVSTPNVFPNTFLGLRFALPRGPFMSELWSFTAWDKDAPQGVIDAVRLQMVQKDNFSGVLEQDDTDNWRQMTDSGRSPTGRKYLSVLSMGAGHAGSHPQLVGKVTERFISENNQRTYYARWQEFMNAGSWADIHVDPITANFEGTAGMKD